MSRKTKQPFIPVSEIGTLSMIEHVEIIAVQADDSQLSDEFLKTVYPHTKFVSDFLGITQMQSVFLSTLITINLQNESVEFAEIARYFDLNCISIAKYIPDLKILIDRQLIRSMADDNRRRRRQTQLSTQVYYVNRSFYDALQHGRIFEPAASRVDDVFDLLKMAGQLISGREEDQNEAELLTEIKLLMKQNVHLQFVQDIGVFALDDRSLLLFLLICSIFIDDPNENVDLPRVVSFLFPEVRDNMKIRKMFLNNDHELQKNDLLEMEKGSFRNDTQVILTEKAWGMIVGENKDMFSRTKMPVNKQFQVIRSEDIIEKKLFYSEAEQKEIDFMIDTMKPENYSSLIKRLAGEGLPQGLCILFYGEAGTSKTQLSYSIAKQTGRDVFNFQVSEAKSMYYGESQKLIKRAFDHYREMVEKSSQVPIFLMNEADSILTKRRSDSTGNQGIMQTENAIQTIILNELETLKGILIATTNLQDNFDNSFYRRFLIKKKFEKPGAEIRKLIWSDKLPWLAEDELVKLSMYETTGAIIENCQRKLVLQQALYGMEKPGIDLIISYLQEENVGNDSYRNRIGFTV